MTCKLSNFQPPQPSLPNDPATAQTNQQGNSDGGAEQPSPSITSTTKQDWVRQTISASEQDARRQPWKKHFANTVESRIDDGQDLVVVKKIADDSSCPFQIQGSSLAA